MIGSERIILAKSKIEREKREEVKKKKKKVRERQ